MELTREHIAAARLFNSGLIQPFATAAECVGSLFGIQAQAQQFAEISLFNRATGTDRKALAGYYEDHDYVKIWGQRMTIHMYIPGDMKYIREVYSGRNDFVRRGWDGNEVSFRRCLDAVERAALTGKVLNKKEIHDIIESVAPEVTNQYRDYSIIIRATHLGILFGIPENPGTDRFCHSSRCASPGDPAPDAMEELVTRYFTYYGPASVKDFMHWNGLTVGEVKPTLERLLPGFRKFTHQGREYFATEQSPYLNTGKEPEELIEPDTILMPGKFDPLFVAYSHKEWIADPRQQKEIWRPAGHVESVILRGTQLLAVWRYITRGRNMDFIIYPLARITAADKKRIAKKAAALAHFMSKTPANIEYGKF